MKMMKFVMALLSIMIMVGCESPDVKDCGKCKCGKMSKAACKDCKKKGDCASCKKKKACCKIKKAVKVTPVYNQALVSQLTGNLQNALGEKVSAESIKSKKYLMVYYSAHWCGPCRSFTPKLVKWYNENHADYDVVFVSSDRNNADMLKYMKGAKMPWAGTVKGSKAEKALKKFQNGRGIPCLVLIDENGKRISSSYNNQGKYTGAATAYKHLQTLLNK